MKKIATAMVLTISMLISFDISAWPPGTYTRKIIKPDFFVPEKDINHVEKLPPIPEPATKSSYPSTQAKTHDNDLVIKEISSILEENSVPEPFDISDVEPSKHIDFQAATKYTKPLYKEKYDDYLKDLSIIAKTGQIPDNNTLKEDLAKMNSDIRIPIE